MHKSSPTPHSSKFSELFLESFVNWDLSEPAIDIIDFDLTGERKKVYGRRQSRDQMRARLCTLRELLVEELNHFPESQVSFMQMKLAASELFLDALDGKEIPFDEYISGTMGFRPRKISKESLQRRRDELFDQLATQGIESPEQFLMEEERGNRIEDASMIIQYFRAHAARIIEGVSEWLGVNDRIQYTIKTKSLDAYWYNWISTDSAGNIQLDINIWPEHNWTECRIESMVAHELAAHALQASCWQARIRAGELHPSLGITTVFHPEQFALEGIAQSMQLFTPFVLLKHSEKHQRAKFSLLSAASNNAHMDVSHGVPLEEVVNEFHALISWREDERNVTRKRLAQECADPLLKTYRYVYGASYLCFEAIAKRLSPEAKCHFVREIFSEPLSVESLLARWGGGEFLEEIGFE